MNIHLIFWEDQLQQDATFTEEAAEDIIQNLIDKDGCTSREAFRVETVLVAMSLSRTVELLKTHLNHEQSHRLMNLLRKERLTKTCRTCGTVNMIDCELCECGAEGHGCPSSSHHSSR